jgi:hypothetical protein
METKLAIHKWKKLGLNGDFFVLVFVSILLQISHCIFKYFGFSPLKPNSAGNQ